ncbi:hypothetical protein KC19_1G128700 [Ceratodon purpureus]|uniref:Uncharacterized protein n=1 Tax=Ceratodon purpureus TaxID=3225 RepID=A0A8T0J4I0_CERPU|nr:hypothetical protein KC19_N018200 [Ceratodon purpureus]KAG0590814.1 hypothetical protein KC19_1G128700 [Ceratodon purpureus]
MCSSCDHCIIQHYRPVSCNIEVLKKRGETKATLCACENILQAPLTDTVCLCTKLKHYSFGRRPQMTRILQHHNHSHCPKAQPAWERSLEVYHKMNKHDLSDFTWESVEVKLELNSKSMTAS